jgi:hypothetical protein
MLSDDAGGAIIAWTDHRGPGFDIWAVRLKPWGTFAPGWSNGVPVSLAASDQVTPRIGSDGAGGAILAWSDYRSNTSFAYAQHIDRFAQLGSPEPSITRVKDLPGDQGGQLRLDWSASYLDADPLYGISAYWIWRQAPLSLATQAVANGARWLDSDLATRMRAMSTGERESLVGSTCRMPRTRPTPGSSSPPGRRSIRDLQLRGRDDARLAALLQSLHRLHGSGARARERVLELRPG